jgi:hypothetical protein
LHIAEFHDPNSVKNVLRVIKPRRIDGLGMCHAGKEEEYIRDFGSDA